MRRRLERERPLVGVLSKGTSRAALRIGSRAAVALAATLRTGATRSWGIERRSPPGDGRPVLLYSMTVNSSLSMPM